MSYVLTSTLCVTDGNGNAWLGLEVTVDDSDDEVFIHHSQRKDGEATRHWQELDPDSAFSGCLPTGMDSARRPDHRWPQAVIMLP